MFPIPILLLLMADDSSNLTPGDHRRALNVDGRARDYLVHVPKGYDGSRAFPVVLAFHGGLSNADRMVDFSGLSEKGDQAGFLAVYPNGTGRAEGAYTWNGGNCCGYAQDQNVDDVAFVRALLDDLERVARVDAKRIYATGMSNGGLMAYRLADELSDRIVAIAPVGGPMGTETCRPKRPVSVIHFHGTDDKFAPFTGGRGERSVSQTHFYSVQHSLDNWIRANGCPREPVVTALEPVVSDGTRVTKSVYGPGREQSEVVLVRIEGAGHTWPGRKPPLLFLGKSTANISANDLMWEFFEKHPRK
ncbi:MAG TPA: PHB depolymerase family esterase [Planctomycetaceae bacterium]|nr:PHB depolymerase family esterase [Planctomycetaceae bacterium]